MFTTRLRPFLAPAVLAGALLGLAACDNVGVSPESEASAENVFTEDGSYTSFLAKLYGAFNVTGQQGPAGDGDIEGLDEGFSQYMRLYWELQELPGDAAVIAWDDAGIRELNNHSWSSSNQFVTAMYYRIFFAVAQANEFLRQSTPEKLDEYGVTQGRRARIPQYRAEARFVRALAYWHGIDFYGDIPVVTEEFGLGIEAPEQNTRVEVFQFIESELLAITEGGGEETLPEIGQGEYGRADQGAAYMLLAKLYQNAPVYIGEDRSSDVVAYAERIIDSGAYSLEADYHDLFLADNHTADGIIFAIPQDGQFTQHFGGTTFLVHAPYGGSMNPEVFGIDGGWFGLRTTSTYVDFYGEGDRRPVFPGVEPEGAQFYQDGQSKEINNISVFTEGFAVPKYQNVTSEGAPGSSATFPDTDFPMFRLADAYLMYAEAVLRGGGGSQDRALELVNALRARAFQDDDTGDDDGSEGQISAGDLTLDFILEERARELMWEAHRRTDLIRFDRFAGGSYLWAWKGGVPEGQATAECRTVFPIPAPELRANPNLSQNRDCYGAAE